jgi:hypothetical protein
MCAVPNIADITTTNTTTRTTTKNAVSGNKTGPGSFGFYRKMLNKIDSW